MPDTTIQTDIENNKVTHSCSMKIVDNKLSVSFCIEDRTKTNYEDSYTRYDKIFLDWQEFVDYCNIFFAEQFTIEDKAEG